MILDTDILIARCSPRHSRGLKQKVTQVEHTRYTTAVNWAELSYGLVRRQTSRGPRLRAEFEELRLSALPVLPFAQEDAEIMACLRVDLEKRGQPLDTNELMIAAIALRHKLPLVTGPPSFRACSWTQAGELARGMTPPPIPCLALRPVLSSWRNDFLRR